MITNENTLAAQMLLHARWHCQYGSQLEDRIPDAADQQAALILKQMSILVHEDMWEDGLLKLEKQKALRKMYTGVKG